MSDVADNNQVIVPADTRKTCGIVMPIAGMGEEYPDEHWRRVRKILQRSIERAGLRPRLVWENAEVDVIQSAILQNLYENDVVVCDLSGLNPNVMLEAGLRLSTRKPTVIVTDKVVKPPFDIGVVGYIEYQKDLEYNAIEDFIDRLSGKISAVSSAFENQTYKSFVENFKFETITPTTVSVPAEEHFREQLDAMAAAVRRIERAQRGVPGRPISSKPRGPHVVEILGHMSSERADEVENKLDSLAGFGVSTVTKVDDRTHRFVIAVTDTSPLTPEQANRIVGDIVGQAELDDL